MIQTGFSIKVWLSQDDQINIEQTMGENAKVFEFRVFVFICARVLECHISKSHVFSF